MPTTSGSICFVCSSTSSHNVFVRLFRPLHPHYGAPPNSATSLSAATYCGREIPSGPNIMYAAKRRATIALPMSSIVRRSTENLPHRRVLSTTKASQEIVDIAFAMASDSRSNEREE